MTLHSRIWWIVITVLATLFVGGELNNWQVFSSIKGGRSAAPAIASPRALNAESVANLMGYPEKAVRAGIEGQVLLRIWVDEAGNYDSHEVRSADHPLLRMACEVYAPVLEFEPAIQDGQPVPAYLDVPFRFSLN